MQNEEKIISILEKITDNLDILFKRVDTMTQKIDSMMDTMDSVNNNIDKILNTIDYGDEIEYIRGVGLEQDEIYITIEETQFNTTSHQQKIEMLDEEVKELRNDLSNIQQITAMNLKDIGKLKAKR